jgi:AcrR family transcriptional regulator
VADVKSRPGRPRAGEREERRAAILDAAIAELTEHGVEAVTMLGIAQRAGASKETLYSWFGSREGLFEAMIERNGDRSAEVVRRALSDREHPVGTLVGYCSGLLTLLTGEPSVSLNRAAMASPELASQLLASGRHRIGPIVEEYLSSLIETGMLEPGDPAAMFQLLYGLTVTDTQIRVLLGEPAPADGEIRSRAIEAVERFLALVGGPH